MITSNEYKSWEKCYLCGSNSLKVFYNSKKIFKCKKCSFVFYKPIPSDQELSEIYSKYTREECITEISKENIRKEFSNIFEINEVNKVLDIACGECGMLEMIRELKPSIELFGSEHESARKNIEMKNINYLKGGFYPETNEKFDLIIFTEAIEHINDVNEFIKNILSLLSKNGMIYITTPNFNCIERFLMQSDWGMVLPPEHLSYFTAKTLSEVLTRNGLEKIFLKTENISFYRIMEYLNQRRRSKGKSAELSPQNVANIMQKAVSKNLILGFIKSLVNLILRFTRSGSSMKALYKIKEV
jgi:2-polyprenyl-3-methyl-5-hydroxy-6-metoxy-1,4-benzoquinol methylase